MSQNTLDEKQVTKILSKIFRFQENELQAFKENCWFEGASFQRSFGKKPSWLNPIFRIFFNVAMRRAVEMGTKIQDRAILILPVWHCQAYENPESKWSLQLLAYFGPEFNFELFRFKKPVLVHAKVRIFEAPYISRSAAYAPSISLPRFGPYAVVNSYCGFETVEIYEASEVESILPAPDLELPPYNESLVLAVPQKEIPAVFRTWMDELIGSYEETNAEINRDAS
ncbi:hypothetical protein [Leptospira kmetyi]|uniref:hypothetical protein n=1 Tax=Leptospira kmetyi TaxID=408139 RepID=UPI001083F739|nr:hypothetical protein [Leptospira kmetyi]TGL70363.1 hypothetical protein EHQ67_06145 [Leptospira kmetyi]